MTMTSNYILCEDRELHYTEWGAGNAETVVLWHGTFLINSLAHRFGSKRYATGDESRNNFALALLTLGEGWHNNHHHYQSSANQGFFWWEIDLSLYALRALRRLRLVWDLREPPAHIRDAVMKPATPGVTDEAPVAPALARARSA